MSNLLNPLGIVSNGGITRLLTPFATNAPQAFAEFLKKAAAPGAMLRTMIYGCTLDIFFDALVAAKAAGADVRVIFDHTQAEGRAEHAQIEKLMGEGFVDGKDFLIGTSPQAHQIVHLKATFIRVGDQSFIEEGSWNYSASATAQVNHLAFSEDADWADLLLVGFDYCWNWIQTNEPQYQQQN